MGFCSRYKDLFSLKLFSLYFVTSIRISEFLVRCGNTHSTWIRRHIYAEVVTYWRLLLCFKIVMQNAKYELFIEHVLFIHNLIIMFSYSDGTFYLWETNTWTSEQWSSTSGFVKVYVVYIHV